MGSRVGGERVPKLVWRVKLVAELQAGETTEIGIAGLEGLCGLALQLHLALRFLSLGHNRRKEPGGWCIVGGDAGVVVVVVAGGQSPDAFLVYARACGDLGEFVFGRITCA
jgi:hypothetical protein